MKMRFRFSFLPLIVASLLVGSCEDNVVTPDTTPAARPLELKSLRAVPGVAPPAGLQVTEDGRWVVASGYRTGLAIFTADGLDVVNQVRVGNLAGVVTRPGESSFFATGFKVYGSALTIPGLAWGAPFQVASTRAVRDRRGTFFYAVGETPDVDGIFKLDPTGQVVGVVPLAGPERNYGFELTPDEKSFLAIHREATGEYRLIVAGTDPFEILRRIPIEHHAHTIIPLEDSRRALLFESEWDGVRGSLIATLVDFADGTVLRTRRIDGPTGAIAGIPVGDPWAYLPGGIALLGTGIGMMVVDTRTGEISPLPHDSSLGSVERECCAVAWDPVRSRVLIAGHRRILHDGRSRLALEAFEIVESGTRGD